MTYSAFGRENQGAVIQRKTVTCKVGKRPPRGSHGGGWSPANPWGGHRKPSRRHQAEPEEEGVCPEGGEGLGWSLKADSWREPRTRAPKFNVPRNLPGILRLAVPAQILPERVWVLPLHSGICFCELPELHTVGRGIAVHNKPS